MRELDQLLGWYLDHRYAKANAAAQSAFAELLEQPDPELWHWLSGECAAPTVPWRQIVDEIRSRDRV